MRVVINTIACSHLCLKLCCHLVHRETYAIHPDAVSRTVKKASRENNKSQSSRQPISRGTDCRIIGAAIEVAEILLLAHGLVRRQIEIQ